MMTVVSTVGATVTGIDSATFKRVCNSFAVSSPLSTSIYHKKIKLLSSVDTNITRQSINQSIDCSISPSINQSINRLLDQSINQPINRSIYLMLEKNKSSSQRIRRFIWSIVIWKTEFWKTEHNNSKYTKIPPLLKFPSTTIMTTTSTAVFSSAWKWLRPCTKIGKFTSFSHHEI